MEPFALAALLFWIALTLDRARAWPSEMVLPRLDRGDPPAEDEVVAIVPARNEAATLQRTLPSLLAQERLAGVVVVDDSSEDRTAATARRVATATGKSELLTVITAPPSPPGRAGKVWALAHGIEELEPARGKTRRLLLTDADIVHRPGSIRSLIAQAERGYELVSVMARLQTESFWERLLVPTFVYFFQLLYPFRKVADPDSRLAAAAGGCVLVERRALDAAGGMAAIAGAVIDDVALARSVARTGGRLWLGLDDGIRSVRPYPRLAGLWRMVARSAYDQLGYRLDRLLLVLIALSVFFVAPPVYLAAALAPLAGGTALEPGAVRTALWATATLSLQLRALRPAVAHHGLRLAWAVVLPLSSLLFGAMTLGSAWAHHTGRGVSWRGRVVGHRGPRG